MLNLDPLDEEAAYIAAAVNEGSLAARDLIWRVHARADALGCDIPFDHEMTFQHAAEVDVRRGRGEKLSLAGVPFLVVGTNSIRHAAPFERAGAVHLRLEPGITLALSDAAAAIADGVAAFAHVVAPSMQAPASGLHALMPAGRDYAILARSSRDLAIVIDAIQTAGGSSDTLCRPLTAEVGRGAGSLMIGVMDGVKSIETARLARCVAGAVIAPCTSLPDFDQIDALIGHDMDVVPRVALARLALPMKTCMLHVAAKRTDVAIRIGAAIDAASLMD
jgi:hypothetical protein